MATKIWAIVLMVICTFFTSTAQIFYKFGTNQLELNLASILSNYPIFIGMLLYMVGAVLMILSFRGGEVSVLFPIIATSYIWVALLSMVLLGEVVNIFKWVGIAVIFLGMVLTTVKPRRFVNVS